MAESDQDRRQRILKMLHTREKEVPPEVARLADAVWNERDETLAHDACIATLPTFVGDEVDGKPVAQLYPEVKHHLDRCPTCSAQYAGLLQIALAEEDNQLPQLQHLPAPDLSFLPSHPPIFPRAFETWKQNQLAAIAAQLHGLVLLRNPALVASAATFPVEQGQAAAGTLRWQISEDDERNLVIRIASPNLQLEGAPLRLAAGAWQRGVILVRVTPDQVGAEEILTRQERSTIPPDSPLYVEIPLSDEE